MVLCERVNKKNKTNVLFCGTVHYVQLYKAGCEYSRFGPRCRGRFTGETSAIP